MARASKRSRQKIMHVN